MPNKTGSHEQEIELIVSAAEGNREAFGVLYAKYFNQVFHHIFFLVSDYHTAEDLTEQTFLKALEAIPRYEMRGIPFLAWLLKIAYNLAGNHRRNRSNGTDRLPGIEPPDSRYCPEILVETIEDRRRVRRMVENLKEDQQKVIVMHFFDGLSYPDIAKVLGKRVGAVWVIQYRALQALRQGSTA